MEIKTYFGEYDDEIISLILDIQNKESKINLSLQEQPDLLDIRHAYQDKGGQFWLALSRGVGMALYQELLTFAKAQNVKHIILDTPSVARAAHRFYEHADFYQICTEDLPVPYTYPDRNCDLYMLDL